MTCPVGQVPARQSCATCRAHMSGSASRLATGLHVTPKAARPRQYVPSSSSVTIGQVLNRPVSSRLCSCVFGGKSLRPAWLRRLSVPVSRGPGPAEPRMRPDGWPRLPLHASCRFSLHREGAVLSSPSMRPAPLSIFKTPFHLGLGNVPKKKKWKAGWREAPESHPQLLVPPGSPVSKAGR